MQFLHTYNRDRATMINYMIRFLGFGVPLAIIALITTLIAALGYRTRLVPLTPAFSGPPAPPANPSNPKRGLSFLNH